MRVLITGAAGMIGRKLTRALLGRGALQGRPISQLILHDIVAAEATAPHLALVGDLAASGTAAGLMRHHPEVIFHLAGVVSGEAEANFDLGYRVNVDGTRALFDAIRAAGHSPRVVYASTTAVFGGPFPEEIPDDFAPTPHSSYGAQKLIGEALLADYSRRGFMDGIGLRLPTICVRPGKANKAASSFFSAIIREPLNRLPADLPVPRDWLHTMASPRAAVGFFLHAAELDLGLVGLRRNLTLPGAAVTVAEQIAALTRAAGADVARLIRDVPDPAVWAIVQSWPRRFAATRAKALGFRAEASFDEILQVYLEDDLHRV
ncbi:NAD-dependent epimerase [Cypionkella aquatica]|uniref:NAD-dependent epimerase n=2 Tax=Cypionkella aquatica TaxID=1756042 RepID=A0AA37X2F6_9RHOB|nr:NAD-dependent epimerase [Cypionkella aquatica]